MLCMCNLQAILIIQDGRHGLEKTLKMPRYDGLDFIKGKHSVNVL